jgi:hypothetical protein
MGVGYFVRSRICGTSPIVSRTRGLYLIGDFSCTAQENGLSVSGRSTLRGLAVRLAVKIPVAADPPRVDHVMPVPSEIV